MIWSMNAGCIGNWESATANDGGCRRYVASELPGPDRRCWAASLPAWVEGYAVPDEFLTDPRWQSLHRGEQAALALATVLKTDLVLMDERVGVGVARKNG